MRRSVRLLAAVLPTAVVIAVVPLAAAGDAEDNLRSVGNRIAELNAQVDDAARDRSALARELEAMTGRLDAVLESVAAVSADLVTLETELIAGRVALDETRRELEVQQVELAATRSELDGARDAAFTSARETYMGAGLGVPQVAFSAKAVSEIALGIDYLDRVSLHSERVVTRFEALVVLEEEMGRSMRAQEAAIALDVAALEEDEQLLEDLGELLERRSDELQAEYERQRQLLDEVDGEIAEWEGEISALEREQASIRALISSAAEPAGRSPGALVRPVPGAISSHFGPRVHPISGLVKKHNGVDMNAGLGQPIVAAEAGTVILAGPKGGYGTTVMVDHGGGMVTLYAHQSRLTVGVGQPVAAGERIGFAGSTGQSTAPHLHFEVRMNGTPVDPARYL